MINNRHCEEMQIFRKTSEMELMEGLKKIAVSRKQHVMEALKQKTLKESSRKH